MSFLPHRFCYLNNHWLIAQFVVNDSLIFLAYLLIGLNLFWISRVLDWRIKGWMFVAFGVFIISCGFGHAIDVWNVWNGNYAVTLVNRYITQVSSTLTAIAVMMVRRDVRRLLDDRRSHP